MSALTGPSALPVIGGGAVDVEEERFLQRFGDVEAEALRRDDPSNDDVLNRRTDSPHRGDSSSVDISELDLTVDVDFADDGPMVEEEPISSATTTHVEYLVTRSMLRFLPPKTQNAGQASVQLVGWRRKAFHGQRSDPWRVWLARWGDVRHAVKVRVVIYRRLSPKEHSKEHRRQGNRYWNVGVKNSGFPHEGRNNVLLAQDTSGKDRVEVRRTVVTFLPHQKVMSCRVGSTSHDLSVVHFTNVFELEIVDAWHAGNEEKNAFAVPNVVAICCGARKTRLTLLSSAAWPRPAEERSFARSNLVVAFWQHMWLDVVNVSRRRMLLLLLVFETAATILLPLLVARFLEQFQESKAASLEPVLVVFILALLQISEFVVNTKLLPDGLFHEFLAVRLHQKVLALSTEQLRALGTTKFAQAAEVHSDTVTQTLVKKVFWAVREFSVACVLCLFCLADAAWFPRETFFGAFFMAALPAMFKRFQYGKNILTADKVERDALRETADKNFAFAPTLHDLGRVTDAGENFETVFARFSCTQKIQQDSSALLDAATIFLVAFCGLWGVLSVSNQTDQVSIPDFVAFLLLLKRLSAAIVGLSRIANEIERGTIALKKVTTLLNLPEGLSSMKLGEEALDLYGVIQECKKHLIESFHSASKTTKVRESIAKKQSNQDGLSFSPPSSPTKTLARLKPDGSFKTPWDRYALRDMMFGLSLLVFEGEHDLDRIKGRLEDIIQKWLSVADAVAAKNSGGGSSEISLLNLRLSQMKKSPSLPACSSLELDTSRHSLADVLCTFLDWRMVRDVEARFPVGEGERFSLPSEPVDVLFPQYEVFLQELELAKKRTALELQSSGFMRRCWGVLKEIFFSTFSGKLGDEEISLKLEPVPLVGLAQRVSGPLLRSSELLLKNVNLVYPGRSLLEAEGPHGEVCMPVFAKNLSLRVPLGNKIYEVVGTSCGGRRSFLKLLAGSQVEVPVATKHTSRDRPIVFSRPCFLRTCYVPEAPVLRAKTSILENLRLALPREADLGQEAGLSAASACRLCREIGIEERFWPISETDGELILDGAFNVRRPDIMRLALLRAVCTDPDILLLSHVFEEAEDLELVRDFIMNWVRDEGHADLNYGGKRPRTVIFADNSKRSILKEKGFVDGIIMLPGTGDNENVTVVEN